MGHERHFLVKNIFQVKRMDSEKEKLCEFISIPQIVELGKWGKRETFCLDVFKAEYF